MAWISVAGFLAIFFQAIRFPSLSLARCGSILPDIRREYFHNRPVVAWRIEGNALQRIDCAQPHLYIRLIVAVNAPSCSMAFV